MNTASKKIVVTAPGNLMLFGEHAVLHAKTAIACAINRRITVTLTPRHDHCINIASTIGNLTTNIKTLTTTPPFEFVLTAIMQVKERLKFGFDLNITTDFPATMGLGSSAAVTVAACGALHYWLHDAIPDLRILQQNTTHVIQQVQGIGSGTDAAASIFGGVIAYNTHLTGCNIEKLATVLPLTVVYSGSKLPTGEVINIVKATQDKYPEIFARLYSAIDSCALKAIDAIKTQNWQQLGEIANIHQGLQDALGINNEILTNLISLLRTQPNIYGAKISGSGLGDCVIGIGSLDQQSPQEFDRLLQTAKLCQNPNIQKLALDIDPIGITFAINESTT